MGLFKFLQSAVSELLTIPSIDPYKQKYEPPVVTGTHEDAKGRTVLEVKAQNYRDVGKVTEGITAQGDVYIVNTRVGHNKWEVHIEDWDIPEEKK